MHEMPLTIGGVLLAGAVLFCFESTRSGRKEAASSVGKHCLCFGAVSLLLSSWIFPWETFSRNVIFSRLSAPLQFAWRFLGPADFFLCIVSAAGIVLYVKRQHDRKWMAGIMILATLLSVSYYFDRMSQETQQWADKMQLEGEDTCDALYMYMNGDAYEEWNYQYYREEAFIKTLAGTETEFEDYRKSGTEIRTKLISTANRQEEDYLLFPLYWYPGYRIEVNGQQVETLRREELVACELPEAPAEICVRYEGLLSFKTAKWVTLAVAMGMGIYFAIFSVAKYIKKS